MYITIFVQGYSLPRRGYNHRATVPISLSNFKDEMYSQKSSTPANRENISANREKLFSRKISIKPSKRIKVNSSRTKLPRLTKSAHIKLSNGKLKLGKKTPNRQEQTNRNSLQQPKTRHQSVKSHHRLINYIGISLSNNFQNRVNKTIKLPV